jgi:hypothetical protein
MKKFLLILILIIFSSPVYAQAIFPVTNKRIVTDLWCDFLATKLEANTKNYKNVLASETINGMKVLANGSAYDRIITNLANDSTIYKNLCMK